MNSTAIAQQPEKLPHLIERAAAALAKATTPAEFLEARDQAAFVYDAAKVATRFAKTKQAHDTIIAACRKAMADALLIEARAMMHLADEYDAAQARGEAPTAGRPKTKIIPDENNFASAKLMMTARKIRDAEKAKPGFIEKTLTAGEPTRARLMRAVDDALTPPKPVTAPQPAQASMVPPPYSSTVVEKPIPSVAEPNEQGKRDASQLPFTATTGRMKIWALGFTEGVEEVAQRLEAALNAGSRCACPLCRAQHDTPESKIRAAALAEAIAVAREVEEHGWKTIEYYED
jgi:hypothetical protein